MSEGVYKAWPTRKEVIKKIGSLKNNALVIEDCILELKEYLVSKSDESLLTPSTALKTLSFRELFPAMRLCLEEGCIHDTTRFQKIAEYQLASLQQKYVHHEHRAHSKGSRVSAMDITVIGDAILLLSIFGHRDSFLQAVNLAYNAIEKGYLSTMSEKYFGAQVFSVYLSLLFLNRDASALEKYFDSEDVFIGIAKNFKSQKMEDIEGYLMELCDRHTYHTSASGVGGNYPDFDNLAYMHFPIEILMILRLREWMGLPNPKLDHPLMAAPFDTLPEINDDFNDALLNSINEKVRHVQPDFDSYLKGNYIDTHPK